MREGARLTGARHQTTMTTIAKIALIGNEVVVTKYALEKVLKTCNFTSQQKQVYARVINKIDKATQKHEANKAMAKQIEIEFR